MNHESGGDLAAEIAAIGRELGQIARTTAEADHGTRLGELEGRLGEVAVYLAGEESVQSAEEPVIVARHQREPTYESRNSHLFAQINMETRCLHLGREDERGISLGKPGTYDYPRYRAELFRALTQTQPHGEITAADLWQRAYKGEEPYNPKVMDKFRQWCDKVRYRDQQVAGYDKQKDSFSVPDFEISLEYITEADPEPQREFVLPSGYVLQNKSAQIAAWFMGLDEKESVTAADIRENLYGEDVRATNTSGQDIKKVAQRLSQAGYWLYCKKVRSNPHNNRPYVHYWVVQKPAGADGADRA